MSKQILDMTTQITPLPDQSADMKNLEVAMQEKIESHVKTLEILK